jgi:hypothetical protein
MGYTYSLGLCREALRLLCSGNSFESRLSRAFSEMNVAKKGDTSDEIWAEWVELNNLYNVVSTEIYKQGKEGNDIPHAPRELEEIVSAFVGLLCDWIEFNTRELGPPIEHGEAEDDLDE